jgi:hypothetical protein
VNPETECFWVVDYRIFDPDTDGKSKLDHVQEMLGSAEHRRLPFRVVLMDSSYATKELMVLIDGMEKTFYCPLKSNRQVDDSEGERPYRRVDALDWSEQELKQGKLIKIKGFPKDYKVKLFRVVVSSNRTEWIVTKIFLGTPRRRRKRCVPCVGRSRSFTAKPQAVDGDRGLPVPRLSHPAKPHSVCVGGLEPSEKLSQSEWTDHLPDQAQFAPQLLGAPTQKSLR